MRGFWFVKIRLRVRSGRMNKTPGKRGGHAVLVTLGRATATVLGRTRDSHV